MRSFDTRQASANKLPLVSCQVTTTHPPTHPPTHLPTHPLCPAPPNPQVNLRTMNQLAKILRQKRADRGALSVRRAPRTFGQALAGVRAGRRLWCAGMTVFRAGCATLYAPVS